MTALHRSRSAGSYPFAAFLLLLGAPAWAQEEGILKVKSNIAGADVYLDGALLGDAPLTQYVPAGVHQLRVVADDHDPYVRKVEIIADRTTDVSAALSPGLGTVEFTGPAGAHLFIGGVDRGPMPIRLTDLSPGAVSWRVEAPKFEPTSGELTFERGKNLLLNVEMPSSRGVFVVESTPPGATVLLDNAERGVTPLRLENVDPGVHTVALTHPERATVLRTVDTSDGDRGEVKATLPDSGGTLKVVTGQDDARVSLNGSVLGTGERVEIGPIEKGKVKLRVESSAGTAEDTVSVPSSGTLALKVENGKIEEIQPLTQRWGFWAAVGGGVVLAGGGVATAVVLSQPEPPPTGDALVTLP